MSVEARITAALGSFGDPVEKSRYYTFACSSQGEDWADDEPGFELWQVNVHFFAPLDGNYTRRVRQTKLALHQAGFTWPRCYDASDQEGQHFVFECEIAEEVDPDGQV